MLGDVIRGPRAGKAKKHDLERPSGEKAERKGDRDCKLLLSMHNQLALLKKQRKTNLEPLYHVMCLAKNA